MSAPVIRSPKASAPTSSSLPDTRVNTDPIEQAVKVLLAEVAVSVSVSDWHKVKELSEAVVKLQPENETALKFISLASDHIGVSSTEPIVAQVQKALDASDLAKARALVKVYWEENPNDPEGLKAHNMVVEVDQGQLTHQRRQELSELLRSSHENMGPVKAYTSFLKNYFNFSGRASLSEYWWVIPVNIVLGFIPFVAFVLFIPGIALSVRRLHDTGKSGWHILLVLVPIVGWIALVMWYAQRGDRFPNDWGEPPAATSS
jgi:uncharacterized membrane protein YhaH (DUF805 family)